MTSFSNRLQLYRRQQKDFDDTFPIYPTDYLDHIIRGYQFFKKRPHSVLLSDKLFLFFFFMSFVVLYNTVFRRLCVSFFLFNVAVGVPTACVCILSTPPANVIRHALFVTPDVDECKSSEAVCSKHAVCTNTVGSFVCACDPEYTGDARAADGCQDIDECETLERPCGTQAICENAAPGYNCVCPRGYRAKPDPQIACEQVNNLL